MNCLYFGADNPVLKNNYKEINLDKSWRLGYEVFFVQPK